jgi:hypothetical protein
MNETSKSTSDKPVLQQSADLHNSMSAMATILINLRSCLALPIKVSKLPFRCPAICHRLLLFACLQAEPHGLILQEEFGHQNFRNHNGLAPVNVAHLEIPSIGFVCMSPSVPNVDRS